MRVSWTALLVLGYFLYLLVGATIFQILERAAERQNRNHFQLEKLTFLKNYSCLDGPALERFVQVILDAWEKGVNPSGNSTNPSNWDFSSSFFFAGTVITTIGKSAVPAAPALAARGIQGADYPYGNLSPSTVSGQVFCVFYALCGIPLNLAFLNQLGKGLTAHLGRLERSVLTAGQHKTVKVLAMSSFLVMGTLLFLVFPPVIFSYVEGWTYGEGFYYAFITLSTIGFGDYVVGRDGSGVTQDQGAAEIRGLKLEGTDPDKHYISIYRSLAGVWIIFGLAWLALLFNLGASVMEHLFQLRHSPCRLQHQAGGPTKQGEVQEQRAAQQAV
ncbi:KCNKG protein, partial [Atractosteus spatula]|nr:KCNKG protein [Atractosteus spatula]